MLSTLMQLSLWLLLSLTIFLHFVNSTPADHCQNTRWLDD